MAEELTVTNGTTTATASTKAVDKEAPGIPDYLNAGAALLWPLLFFCCLWFLRREMRLLVSALASRVADKDSEVVLGPVSLRKIESRLESVEMDQKMATDLVHSKAQAGVDAAPARPAEAPQPKVSSPAAEKTVAAQIPDQLQRIADEYLNVNLPDWNDRVRRKDELTARMALLVVRESVPRRVLAESKNEGILIALAGAIHLDPRNGDDFWLLEGGRNAQRLHVRYRFLASIARLADRKLIRKENQADLRAMCLKYQEGADGSLMARVKLTLAVLDDPART